jgi:hypothetical protein
MVAVVKTQKRSFLFMICLMTRKMRWKWNGSHRDQAGAFAFQHCPDSKPKVSDVPRKPGRMQSARAFGRNAAVPGALFSCDFLQQAGEAGMIRQAT